MIDHAVKTISSHKVGYTFEGLNVSLTPDQIVTETPSFIELLALIAQPIARLAGRAFRSATQVETAPLRRAKA